MKLRLICTASWIMGCVLPVGAADVQTRIEQAPHTHPRLFIGPGDDETIRKKIVADPELQNAYASLLQTADGMIDIEPFTRKQVGRRLLTESRRCLKRVSYLSFAYRMSGDKKYARRAQEEMFAAAKFSDWNPSHFLDVAEMTAALAIGYDWTFDALDPDARETIKRAIIEKGLKPSLKHTGWVKAINNWNQVCHGGMVLGALAVMEDEPELAAELIERAIANVPRSMKEYAPDGAYPEGPSYWVYGTSYNVLLIAALESVLKSDFGLSKMEGFLASSDYYLHTTGPTGLYFNYSDCGSTAGVSPAMYWFSAKRKQPALLDFEREKLRAFAEDKHIAGDNRDRLLPLLFVWAPDQIKTSEPSQLHYQAKGATPIAVHRSAWRDPKALFLGIKGGSPATNHAHMDIGSFVLDAGGVRWAEDLGAQSYHDLESKGIKLWGDRQDSQRWTVFRLNSLSHNTLVVDGEMQRVAGFAPIIKFSDKSPMPHTVVDMSEVYTGQLAKALRGAAMLHDHAVLIQDELQALDTATEVRWGMLTRAEVKIESTRSASLTRDGQTLRLQVMSPASAKLELYNTEKPPAKYDAPNPGTRMIGFTSTVSASKVVPFVVLLELEGGASYTPNFRTLADW